MATIRFTFGRTWLSGGVGDGGLGDLGTWGLGAGLVLKIQVATHT